MNIWKPSRDEVKRIRAAANYECGQPVQLEAGQRFNTETPSTAPYPELVHYGYHLNIAVLSPDPETFEDTDLYDHVQWSDFKKHGVELTPDGRATVDFYCYGYGPEGELESNITVYYANNQITKIDGTQHKDIFGPDQRSSF